MPKQFRPLAGQPLIAWTLAPFARHPEVERITVVLHQDDSGHFDAATAVFPDPRRFVIARGGATRQESVRAGLEALGADAPDIVLVHDAARPFVTSDLISRAIESARRFGAAIPGATVADALVEVDASDRVTAQPERSRVRAVQTPQAFSFPLLLAAHRHAASSGITALTDDGAVARFAGHDVHVFEGDRSNVKLTWSADFDDAERRLGAGLVTRVATGYDVHAFGPGDHVWLGGVRIPHDGGLVGHSDADVALHALTDALLGVVSDGDIGSHFPPGDPQWSGASSDRFLAFAASRVRERGGSIDHLDLTIVCEAPKIGPQRDAMRARIAEIAGVAMARVSVKATTSERLGFTGRREGIAAQATATARFLERDADRC